jgi:hypothetical protein
MAPSRIICRVVVSGPRQANRCVATPDLRAASTTIRTSATRFDSGLCMITCFRFRIAATEIAACRWSGVMIFTLSRSLSFSRSSRKST